MIPTGLRSSGDGKQAKAYLHVEDCVAGVMTAIRAAEGRTVTLNLGTPGTTSVDRIADLVSEAMGVSPTYAVTGDERGWTGDVPRMQLDIEGARTLGWEPTLSSDEAVERAIQELRG